MRIPAKANDQGLNEALIHTRYLGSALVVPTVTICLKVLEAYRQMHRFCPRLSIYAQVKALCQIHKVRDLYSLSAHTQT